MSIQCKDQENDEDITTTSPYVYCASTISINEGHSQHDNNTNTCMAVEQEQPLNNTSIPNTIQVPRRDMKQHPIIQGEL